MPALQQHFADYAAHHTTAMNKATHTFGIPMIALALLGLASRVELYTLPGGPRLDLAVALAAAIVAIYLAWHVGLAIGVAILFVPLYLAGNALPNLWLVVILVVGIVLQYVGHMVFEGKQPAFHRNAIHTLVGPLWMAALLFAALGLYRFDAEE